MNCERNFCGHPTVEHRRGASRCNHCPCHVPLVDGEPVAPPPPPAAPALVLAPLDIQLAFERTPEGYWRFEVDEPLLEAAKERSKRFGELKDSIRKGEGNLAGCLGEIAVALRIQGDLVESYDYDVIRRITEPHVKVEVKTKVRSVKPKEHFNCSVAAANTSQRCDVYMFVSVMKNMTQGWVLGYLDRDSFYKKATFGRKGEPDGEGFKFRADCYNVKTGDLQKEA